jgi:C-terminal processing protease CtpA/Prc
VQIKDKRKMNFNFYLDTGAGLCFLMSDRFAEDSSILLRKRKPVLTQAEGMGGKLQMRLTVVKEVKIGPYHFRDVPTYLYKDEYNVTSYPFVGGLIGNDLLRHFNLVLNYPNHEFHLVPNLHFKEPFDYTYTGLGVYYINGKIMVTDVIDGSPAAKAKFLVGDEIFSVGNNFTHNIQAYKNILQTPDEEIKVIVTRDGKPVLLTLQTVNID